MGSWQQQCDIAFKNRFFNVFIIKHVYELLIERRHGTFKKLICHNARLFFKRTYLNSKFEYLKTEKLQRFLKKLLKVDTASKIHTFPFTFI